METARAMPPQQQQQQQQQQPIPARPPLDQLQFMLNHVLEQTGRAFFDARTTPDANRASAAALNMRRFLPAANTSFQDALDELETQLNMARWVLTRDLSELREANASPVPPPAPVAQSAPEPDPDMAMAEAPAADPIPTEPETTTSMTIDNPTTDSAPVVDAQDTEQQEDDPIDFDALFNSPPATEPQQTDQPQQDQAAMDADLASFLPGLETYAAAPDPEEPTAIDLSTPPATTAVAAAALPDPASIFDLTTPTQAPTGGAPVAQMAPMAAMTAPTTEEKDTTFDDIMNFGDFDFGSLGDGTMDEGTTFDESFFNVE